ncbi:MAG: 23S rRNA (guanosine(2251)-2'-O)-methyltransferase RlmB, partial [Gammaproteobacteria bacterium]|nr:23S rRNA (guanosine(2251)-2'-O)-methyltransferase RlmB [Gammaproteobacteria bacterium]NNJ73184.1 23S rRNA (guanosine(2251)-2'-O)-methyltransferase RlmB [Enterobacterales bacterium]
MSTDYVYGLHACNALLKNNRESILELFVLQGRHDKRLKTTLNRARGIPIQQLSRADLNRMVDSEQHQGIVARIETKSFSNENMLPESSLPEFLNNLGKPAFILVIDGVTDPHNFGACLRTADAAGVDVVITPKDKSVGLTPVVRKVACGAAEVVSICQVTNLARTIEIIQHEGVWVFGADGDVDAAIYDMDLKGNVAMVVGAEGKGMRRLTREKCDHLFQIPMHGSVSSLNVSVATGIC